jgi:phosphatidylglycerol:prolipoprotein diacylglycerol transferase
MYIEGQYREPTFLYESILSVAGFILLLIIRKNQKIKTGQLTGIYMTWYGIVRLIIESFRSDSLMLGPIKIAQLISIILIVVGIYLLTKNQKREKLYDKDTIEKK